MISVYGCYLIKYDVFGNIVVVVKFINCSGFEKNFDSFFERVMYECISISVIDIMMSNGSNVVVIGYDID